jgi:hypothetical protein
LKYFEPPQNKSFYCEDAMPPLWPTISENGGTLDKPYGIKLGCEEKAGRTQENALKNKIVLNLFGYFK